MHIMYGSKLNTHIKQKKFAVMKVYNALSRIILPGTLYNSSQNDVKVRRSFGDLQYQKKKPNSTYKTERNLQM